MKCEKVEELLSPYCEDELSTEERKAVDRHLETCENCSLLFSSMGETMESLTEFPELNVSESLLDRIYAIPSKKRRFKLSFDFMLRPSLQPILAAATILLIVVSIYMFHPERNRINKFVDRQIHLGYSKVERLYAKAESFATSLGEHKENILVSLKNINPLGKD
ncbi:MAG: zf-HC2 domain-containing protein [Candidatus Aminicenantes bacterium]|nr:MAG: zf-HC2 domain-containing protein [Candidatus Aminicenantes bacterium]